MTASRRGMIGGLRRRGALQVWEDRFGPNMTPMVDIVLVILIFFMAGTTFISREWFLRSETLMQSATQKPRDPMDLPPVWLTVRLYGEAGGGTTFSGIGVEPGVRRPLAEFSGAIAEFSKGTDTKKIVVVLAPEREVAYRDVVAAHEACAASGIDRVGVTPP
ncbi:MAG: ExbD/TolR family protein [Phycisphaerales bacterium]